MNPPSITFTPSPRRRARAVATARLLDDSYGEALDAQSTVIRVIATRDEVDARAAALQAKLGALGVTDLTAEGSLVLDGVTEITPGVRRGVSLGGGMIATTGTIGLDTLPEYFSYTNAGRAAAVRPAQTELTVATAVPVTVGDRPARLGTSASLRSTSAGGLGQLTPDDVAVMTDRLDVARTLVMALSPVLDVDEAIIVAEELQLQDGTQLLLANEVKYLTILAQRITIGDGTEIIWESRPPASRGLPDGAPVDGTSHARTSLCDHSWYFAADGGDGGEGSPVDAGYPGDGAPTVEVWALDTSALPAFGLKGGTGGIGQRGRDGGDGGHGAKGADSRGTATGCPEKVGYGGDGGEGGDGGPGGRGGRGGIGGLVILYLTDACHEAVLEHGLILDLAGGDGGPGGPGGIGGQGGLGGEAGEPKGLFCSAKPERAGDGGGDGDDGDTGQPGLSGPLYGDGDAPNFEAIVITEDEFRTKWNAPQIRTVSPSSVEVGDVITVEGANYTSNAFVRVGGIVVATTFIADTILQASAPPVASGWHQVVVEIPGGETSNPGSLEVVPSLSAVTPDPAAPGTQLTLSGSGFDAGCRVLFRATELQPDSVSADGTVVQVTIPRPAGPFEDHGGVETLIVRNPNGVATGSIDLRLRHVLSTGFNVPTNGYSFLNTKQTITGVADLGTFTETYGLVDATLETITHPGRTAAWFAAYLTFFNVIKPGYSSGFAMTAIDEYWKGTSDLAGEHSAMSDVERLLTVAQGHILSREVLAELALQSASGVARAERSLDEIEAAFRTQVAIPDDEMRRLIAPVMQLMPAGLPITPSYYADLSNSHGLLPIRIEYPVDGDPWEKRLVVYDNASGAGVGTETNIDFTRNGGVLDFAMSHVGATRPIPDSPVHDSSTGWTLSHLPLSLCWLSNVSMPLSTLWVSAVDAAFLIEDDQGRRSGSIGGRAWNDIPDVVPGVGIPNLFLLPLDRPLTLTVSATERTGRGSYTLGVIAGAMGRSVILSDVPIDRSTRDMVRVGGGLSEVSIDTGDDAKTLDVRYAIEGGADARGAVLEGIRIGRRGGVTLRPGSDLASLHVESSASGESEVVPLTDLRTVDPAGNSDGRQPGRRTERLTSSRPGG